uniref:Glycosyltransferase n=2 Tax=Rhizophora mucronata TaxID=61149 RepID=A0A2P2IW20_RHIMU
MGVETVAQRPHAILFPFPAQSHMNSMLKLAKVLHHKGLYISFVNIEFNHRRLLESIGPTALDGTPDFRFEYIPDGLPHFEGGNVSKHFFSIIENSIIKEDFLAPFTCLISKLNDTANSNVPPVTCIISDGFMPFTYAAAEEKGLPIVIFFTVSACGFISFQIVEALKEKGLIPIKDESDLTNGYLDTSIDWIPGMKSIRLRDFSFVTALKESDDISFRFLKETFQKVHKASAIILHTFDALEHELLDTLSSMYPAVHPIGPLQLHLNQMQNDELSSIGCSLWKEETRCLQWLDSQKPNSVIYVNFGSIAVMTKQKLIELGMGLAESKQPFLWIIRPDLVNDDSATLPPEFDEETKERGFIASWCPQEEVLNHPSVGGFLTHCGWGSTIEGISAGVPMLCLPFIGDQATNCRYICTEWEIGFEIDSNVKREIVAELVRELMEGKRSQRMKNKAIEWKILAEKATRPGGSSSMNLDKLISQMLL